MALRAGNGAVRSLYFSTTFARRESENEAPPISIVCESVCFFVLFFWFLFCVLFLSIRKWWNSEMQNLSFRFVVLWKFQTNISTLYASASFYASAAPTYRIQILGFTIHIHYFQTHGIFACRRRRYRATVAVFARWISYLICHIYLRMVLRI